MKTAALGLLFVISIVVAVWATVHFALKSQAARFGVELQAVQAALNFNHMQRYGELEMDLGKGCYTEALEKARISKAQETRLLASYLKEHPDTWVTKYVSDRAPKLINELADYQDPYGSSWREPRCSK